MATNYFIKEKITEGARVKIYISFRQPIRFQGAKMWVVNRLLAPWIRLEVRKEIHAPEPFIRKGVYPVIAADLVDETKETGSQ